MPAYRRQMRSSFATVHAIKEDPSGVNTTLTTGERARAEPAAAGAPSEVARLGGAWTDPGLRVRAR